MSRVLSRLAFLLLLGSSLLAAPKRPLGFIILGDWGTGEPAQFEVAKGIQKFCLSHVCDFALGVGDNFYPSGVSTTTDLQWKTKFLDPYQNLRLTFYAALGNHDYEGNIQAQIDFSALSKYWVMKSRYFSFTKTNIDFFVIDSNKFDLDQQKWLEKSISQSKALWKIVYGHHPVYSYGTHGNTEELVKDLLPLISGRVDFYLAGHDHDKQVLLADKNPVFVISGTGASFRPVKKDKLTLYANSTLGFAHIAISKRKATLRMVDATGMTEFRHEFNKHQPPHQLKASVHP